MHRMFKQEDLLRALLDPISRLKHDQFHSLTLSQEACASLKRYV